MKGKALLLAAVALAMLALASPAVARPIVHTVALPHTLSAAAMITVVCLAVALAVALVTGVVLASRPRSRLKEESEPEQPQAPRVKTAPTQRHAVV